MDLFKIFCVAIGVLLLFGCGFSIVMMFYAAYIASIQVVIWMLVGLLSGMVGLMLTYYGSDGE